MNSVTLQSYPFEWEGRTFRLATGKVNRQVDWYLYDGERLVTCETGGVLRAEVDKRLAVAARVEAEKLVNAEPEVVKAGERINRYREEQQMSVAELGRRANLSRATVYQILKGTTSKNPTLRIFTQIARAIGGQVYLELPDGKGLLPIDQDVSTEGGN